MHLVDPSSVLGSPGTGMPLVRLEGMMSPSSRDVVGELPQPRTSQRPSPGELRVGRPGCLPPPAVSKEKVAASWAVSCRDVGVKRGEWEAASGRNGDTVAHLPTERRAFPFSPGQEGRGDLRDVFPWAEARKTELKPQAHQLFEFGGKFGILY